MKRNVSLIVCVILLAVTCFSMTSCNGQNYTKAIELLESGNYEEAKAMFEELGDYKDSQQYLSGFHYVLTNMSYQVSGTSGTAAVTLGENNLPAKVEINSAEVHNIAEYTYDANGNVIREAITNQNGDQTVWENIYDADGKVIKATCSFAGSEGFYSDYFYDEDGKLIREEVVWAEDDKSLYEYTYDANGNVIREDYSNALGDHGLVAYTYDSEGNLILEERTNSDGSKAVIQYTNDADGNLIKKESEDPIIGASVDEYIYDANGNIIKRVRMNADGTQDALEAQYTLVYIPFELSEDMRDLLNNLINIF